MNRPYGIILFLIVCIMISNGKDWLEGGYVGRGDYGEIGQHFNDPLFFPQGSGPYAVDDPAIRNMLISLDMPRGQIPRSADPAIRQMEASLDFPRSYGASGRYSAVYNQAKSAGRMQIFLSDGTIMDLMLYQNQNIISGQGSLNLGGRVEWATARGKMYGNNLQIEVLPTNGVIQYAIFLNTAHQDMTGSYIMYRYGIQLRSGTANGKWVAYS
jgi:hypothetical protein